MRFLPFIILFCFFFSSGILQSQATFTQSLDSTQILIGDPLDLTQSSSVLPKDEGSLEQLVQLEWLEIIEKSDWVFTPAQQYERKIKFSVYDSGHFTIPELIIKLDTQIIKTNPLHLDVFLPLDTLNDLHPIKDIIETEKASYFWIYLGIASLVLSLILILLVILFKADQVRTKSVTYKSIESPHEIALKRLHELVSKKLWQSGKIKLHYDELSYLLRAYLNEGFHISALESSTSEISQLLEESKLSIQLKNEFISFLRNCDLIKFANKLIPVEEHDNWIKFAETMILQNKDLSLQFLNLNKKDYVNVLGEELASQFEFPRDPVHESLLELMSSRQNEQLYLISDLYRIKKFTLPKDWINLHHNRSGQLRDWHLNILQKNPGARGILILLILLPFIAIFLPFMLIIGWQKNENVLSRGIFQLSRDKKLLVNESGLKL